MHPTLLQSLTRTQLKIRAGPAGIHMFDRTTGLNVLLDEIRAPPALWAAAPRQTAVALTNACDLACPYCYAPKSPATLDFSRVASWLDELDANGGLSVGFGGGEPTLYRRFPELCQYAAQLLPLNGAYDACSAKLACGTTCRYTLINSKPTQWLSKTTFVTSPAHWLRLQPRWWSSLVLSPLPSATRMQPCAAVILICCGNSSPTGQPSHIRTWLCSRAGCAPAANPPAFPPRTRLLTRVVLTHSLRRLTPYLVSVQSLSKPTPDAARRNSLPNSLRPLTVGLQGSCCMAGTCRPSTASMTLLAVW